MANKRSRVHPKYKTKYKIRNGSAYDRALVRRGDITLWFTQDGIDAWATTTTGKRGAQAKDSYLANATDDANVVPELLSQVERDIDRFTADAAYDKWLVYSAVAARDARVVIPPSKTAVVSGGDNGAGQSRDTSVARIGEVGRRQWKKESGYHCQVRVENTFYRYKCILGRHMRARDPDGQEVEVRLSCNVLNRLAATGMPESYAIK